MYSLIYKQYIHTLVTDDQTTIPRYLKILYILVRLSLLLNILFSKLYSVIGSITEE